MLHDIYVPSVSDTCLDFLVGSFSSSWPGAVAPKRAASAVVSSHFGAPHL